MGSRRWKLENGRKQKPSQRGVMMIPNKHLLTVNE